MVCGWLQICFIHAWKNSASDIFEQTPCELTIRHTLLQMYNEVAKF